MSKMLDNVPAPEAMIEGAEFADVVKKAEAKVTGMVAKNEDDVMGKLDTMEK